MSGIPQLSAASLFDARLKKDQARHRAYNQILEQALQKVAKSASQPNQPTFVYFTVPPFVLGLPSIDLQDCIIYIVHQLRNQGYEVRYTYPNLLWISWAHHERQYFLEKNPIVQAMLPKMEGPEKRKGTSMITMRSALQDSGPVLRASEYIPPAGFVETMERPSPYSKPRSSVTFSDSTDTLGNVLDDLWKT
jgi:hypothetical protein